MNNSSPPEIEITHDLLDFAKCAAIEKAKECCPTHVDFDDVVQDALLNLLRRPPRHDPARGASVKTLICMIVHRSVLKYVARQKRHAMRFKQLGESPDAPSVDALDLTEEQVRNHQYRTRTGATKHEALLATVDEMLDYIDNKDSRALCRLYIECNGNVSEVARRLKLTEGTVRYRLKLLEPKLRAAKFTPFSDGGMG